MKSILVTITTLLMFASTAIANQSLLSMYCRQIGGKVESFWTCPNTGLTRFGETCVQKNSRGQTLRFNGCSAPNNAFNGIFFKACIIHDLCYHSEPGYSGKSKGNCDQDFKDNMNDICAANEYDYMCYFAAQTYFKAVVTGGHIGWWCEKGNAQYPRIDELP
jgi:hypothetical protein